MTFAFRHLKQITAKQLSIFIVLFILSIALDQWVKFIMLEGFVWESEAITIGGRALVYNKGVAFSMFSFLEEYLLERKFCAKEEMFGEIKRDTC